MSSQWHYRHGDEELGPLSFADLRALVVAGQLSETDLVRRATSDEWVKGYRVIGLFVDGPLVDGPQPAPTSNDASSPASPVPSHVEATHLTWKSSGFWRAPMDRFELAVLGAMVTWLACMVGWWRWNESMEARFPAPSPRRAHASPGSGTIPVVIQRIGSATESGLGSRP